MDCSMSRDRARRGGDVKDLEAIGGLIQHFGDGTHDGGVGFAGTGGHLDQAAVTRQVGAPGFGLEGEGLPALVLEPLQDGS